MILGCDAAGVDAAGREVLVHSVIGEGADETLDPGRTLLSEKHQGTFADKVVVPKANVVPKPASLSFEEAACLPTAWLTAYRMLFTRGRVRPGDRVLVQGAGGGVATAAVLLACLISAGNAASRYALGLTSNAWLEAQWYLFAAIVMLGAAHTLRRNEHVRVDLVYGWVGERTRLWIDVFGILVFLLPGMLLLAWMTWPFFLDSWMRHEVSPNAGGLLRWPVKVLLPVGFALVALQGLAELVKRVAALAGIEDEAARVAAYEKLEQ